MSDLYSNMSGVAQLADHLVTSFEKTFIIEKENLAKGIDSLVTYKFVRGAKTVSFPKYSGLTVVSSALTAKAELTPVAMTDTAISITTAEYGNVVVTTELVDAQSDGLPNLAAVRLCGKNMRESLETIMIKVGEAGSNEIIVTQALEASLTASDTLTGAYVRRAYNKLQAAGAPKPYYALVHPDVYYDLAVETAATGWISTANYAEPSMVLENEIGTFGGFRWIVSPLVSVNADAGSSAVDTYHTQFFAANAFGKAVALEPELRIRPALDLLGRFHPFGWYGIFNYGLVDTDYHWVVTSASSIGSNS